MVIGDNNGSCTRNLYFALRANGEAYPILPEMKQQLWTLPLVREGKTTDMWYVIQVQGGQEEKTAELIKKQLTLCDDSLRECFIPKKERVKKFKGRWQQVEELLFPGYVFADSGNAEELYRRLKQVGRLTKVLQDGNFLFLSLSEDEEQRIKAIGDCRHVTRVSKVQVVGGEYSGKVDGIDRGKKVVVREGPLKGLEGYVTKGDLHKREVTVQMPFAGRMVDVKLGIELVDEKPAREEITNQIY